MPSKDFLQGQLTGARKVLSAVSDAQRQGQSITKAHMWAQNATALCREELAKHIELPGDEPLDTAMPIDCGEDQSY